MCHKFEAWHIPSPLNYIHLTTMDCALPKSLACIPQNMPTSISPFTYACLFSAQDTPPSKRRRRVIARRIVLLASCLGLFLFHISPQPRKAHQTSNPTDPNRCPRIPFFRSPKGPWFDPKRWSSRSHHVYPYRGLWKAAKRSEVHPKKKAFQINKIRICFQSNSKWYNNTKTLKKKQEIQREWFWCWCATWHQKSSFLESSLIQAQHHLECLVSHRSVGTTLHEIFQETFASYKGMVIGGAGSHCCVTHHLLLFLDGKKGKSQKYQVLVGLLCWFHRSFWLKCANPSQHENIKTDLVLMWHRCPEFQATKRKEFNQWTLKSNEV